jgi:hypothetical protein
LPGGLAARNNSFQENFGFGFNEGYKVDVVIHPYDRNHLSGVFLLVGVHHYGHFVTDADLKDDPLKGNTRSSSNN